jgi:hypothetical protein
MIKKKPASPEKSQPPREDDITGSEKTAGNTGGSVRLRRFFPLDALRLRGRSTPTSAAGTRWLILPASSV